MKRLALLAITALALTGCHFTMNEGGSVPKYCCTVHRPAVLGGPDTLDVIMNVGDWNVPNLRAASVRCTNMGGQPIIFKNQLICKGVDY